MDVGRSALRDSVNDEVKRQVVYRVNHAFATLVEEISMDDVQLVTDSMDSL